MSHFYVQEHVIKELIPQETEKLCLFASYEQTDISLENIVYVNTLSEYFDIVIYISNEREVQKPKMFFNANVKCMGTENRSYDFGMWFRILKNIDRTNLKLIGLINDSCSLLHPIKLLQHLKENNLDETYMWGYTDSVEQNFHLQSYFLIFSKEAIDKLKQFVDETAIHLDSSFNQSDLIKKYEIGLSQFMLQQGVPLRTKFKTHVSHNIVYHCWDTLLALSMPIVKKKRNPLSHLEQIRFRQNN